MTSPSTTTGATPAPVYRCASCGREFDRLIDLHHRDHAGRSPVYCSGKLEPIRRDQLVPVGAGDQLGQLDAGGGEGGAAGHENSIVTSDAARTVCVHSDAACARMQLEGRAS